jgi:ABC-type glycerol-3-phosphate transport system permease component
MYLDTPTFSVALSNFTRSSVVIALEIDGGMASYMEVPILLSGCLTFLTPLIIFYLPIQRKFVASIATSGIVG